MTSKRDLKRWVQHLEHGWKVAFGQKMIEELSQILDKYDAWETYTVITVKEKLGWLSWQATGFPAEMKDEYVAWIKRYQTLSEHTCVECGKRGKMRSEGITWVSPYCDEHYEELLFGPLHG